MKNKTDTTINTLKQMTQNQSINITKAVVRGLGDGDKININYAPIMIVSNDPSGDTDKPALTQLEELMWTLLESLPEPKMESIRKLAVHTALKKIRRSDRTAEYFGFQRTYISRLKWELNADPLFAEEPKAIEAETVQEEEKV